MWGRTSKFLKVNIEIYLCIIGTSFKTDKNHKPCKKRLINWTTIKNTIKTSVYEKSPKKCLTKRLLTKRYLALI